MPKTKIYLLEVADGVLWTGIQAYRSDADADKAWREGTIKEIRKAAGDDAPEGLEEMTNPELAEVAERYSDAGFYSTEVIDFYE